MKITLSEVAEVQTLTATDRPSHVNLETPRSHGYPGEPPHPPGQEQVIIYPGKGHRLCDLTGAWELGRGHLERVSTCLRRGPR